MTVSGGQSPNLENLLQMGINQAKSGNKSGAQVLLQQVLDSDKENDRAWLWMAFISDDETDRRRFLHTALKYNPNNQTARKALDKLDHVQTAAQNRTLVYGGMALAGLLLFAAIACVIILAL